MYCGCRTLPAKCTWCFSILFLLAAAIGLALGLYYTVPCSRTLVQCQRVRGNPITNGTRVLTDSECWGNYWQCSSGAGGKAPGLFFWLSVAGAVCLILSLLTCCCFCCQRSPAQKAAKKQQFIQSGATTAPAQATGPTDTAVYSDQYATYATLRSTNTAWHTSRSGSQHRWYGLLLGHVG
jgi:hypothetical protein